MKQNSSNVIYPSLGILCSLVGTGVLLVRNNNEGVLLIWVILLLAANVLWAAATVFGAKEKTVQRKNPAYREDSDLPPTIEVVRQHIPLYPLLLATVAAVGVGFYTGAVSDALLVFFGWGTLGYPLGRCILRQKTFGTSMQMGLIASISATLVAGVAHVFVATPDHSFGLQYCFDLARSGLEELLTKALQSASELLVAQGIDPAGTIFADPSPELAEGLAYSLMLSLPALFAVLVLTILCIVWWICKEVLKRSSKISVGHMGRLDGYVPSRGVSILYFATFFFSLMAGDDVVTGAISNNLYTVLHLVLIFAGYSLVLFIINTRASSKPMRIILAVLTLLLAFDSCGLYLLTFAGLFSSGNLRKALSGGTLK